MKKIKYMFLFLFLFLTILFVSSCRKQKEYSDMKDHVVNSMENAISSTITTNPDSALTPEDYATVFQGIEVTEENLKLFPETDASYFAVDEEESLHGVSIAYCTCEDQVIVVPQEINGKTVVAVNTAAFSEMDCVAVVLPDTVSVIRNAAFQKCAYLEYVYFGSGLKTVEWMTFNTCPLLKKVSFPNGTEKLDGCIFYMCDDLSIIVIPESVTQISENCISADTCPAAVLYTPSGSTADRLYTGSEIPIVHQKTVETESSGNESAAEPLIPEEIISESTGGDVG